MHVHEIPIDKALLADDEHPVDSNSRPPLKPHAYLGYSSFLFYSYHPTNIIPNILSC
jgi:hypothetical protein